MEDGLSLALPAALSLAVTRRELERSRALWEAQGLRLTESDLQALAERHLEALRSAGRVEFGGSILPALMHAFADSPYLEQQTCGQTLAELQELFYALKSESGERMTDGELLTAMRDCFDGPAGGAAEYLSGVSLEELCRARRQGRSAGVPADEEGGDET